MAKRNPSGLSTLLELGVVGGLLYVGYRVVRGSRNQPVIPGQISTTPGGTSYVDVYGNPVEPLSTGASVGGSLNDLLTGFSSGRT